LNLNKRYLCMICDTFFEYGIINHIEKQHNKYAEVKDFMELSR
jgi:hypothetical protein